MASWRGSAGRSTPSGGPIGRTASRPGPDQGDPAVVAAERPVPDPRDLAERPKLVEQPRRDTRGSGPAGCRAPGRRPGSGTPASCSTTSARRSSAAVPRYGVGGRADRGDAVPARQEAGERGGIDRLDLVAEPRERPTSEQSQDVRVAPLALGAARSELAAQE